MERVGERRRRARGAGGGRLLSEARTTTLDLSGAEELCTEPSPLERVRRAYAGLEPGHRLEVRTPIAEHAFAVRAWSRKHGVTIVVDERNGADHRIVLAHDGAPAAGEVAHSGA